MKTTILIADSDIVLLELLWSRCVTLGLDVVAVSRGDDALRVMEQDHPDLVCLEQRLKCTTGQTVCEAMAERAPLARMPLIVLSDAPDEQAARICRDLHAYVIPRGGNLWYRLEPLIYELTDLPLGRTTATALDADAQVAKRIDEPALQRAPARASSADDSDDDSDEEEAVLDAVFAWFGHGAETERGAPLRGLHRPHLRDRCEPPWVLCIEDDDDFSMALKLRLEAHGVAVVRAFDGTSGYRTAFTHPASAILLDYNLPRGQGDYVLRRLKENPVTAEIPVIVLTGNRSATTRRQMLNLGAEAYLTKPLDFAELMEVLEPYVDMLPAEYATIA
jgi:DNA-binding response OmpR family regulator